MRRLKLISKVPEGSFGPIITPQTGAARAFVGVKWSDWVRGANRLGIEYEFKIPTEQSFAETKVAINFELRSTSAAPAHFVTISVFPSIASHAGQFNILMSSKSQKLWGWRALATLWQRRMFSTGFLEVQANPGANGGTQIEVSPAEGSDRIVELFRLGDPISFSIWRASEPVLRLTWGNDADFARDFEELSHEVAATPR